MKRSEEDMEQDKLSKLKIGSKERPAFKARRNWKLIWGISALILLSSFLAFAYHHGLLTPAVSARVAVAGWVHPSQVIADFNAAGYVVAQRKAAVSSKGTGRLSYLGVQEGSRVKEGEVLARLENEDIIAERAQAEAQLAAARSDLRRAETELDTAARNHARLKDLLRRNAVSLIDFENSEDRYLKGKAAVESAKAGVKALEANLKRISVLIEYTVIRAPFDGVVLTKDADVGEVVAPFGSATNAKAAVVTMADLMSLLVEVDVSESFLSRVKIDQPCEVQLDALPDVRFPAKVSTIVPTADRTKGTVMVKVQFDRLDPRVLPEMSAKAAFLTRPLAEGETKAFLGIHKDALAEGPGGQGFFQVVDGRAEWVPFPNPQLFGDYVILGPPIIGGETIALKPPRELKPGAKISISEQK